MSLEGVWTLLNPSFRGWFVFSDPEALRKLAEVETRAERSLVCVHHWSLDTETFSKTATENMKHGHHEILVGEVVNDGSLIFMHMHTVYEMIWYTYDITWFTYTYNHIHKYICTYNFYIHIHLHIHVLLQSLNHRYNWALHLLWGKWSGRSSRFFSIKMIWNRKAVLKNGHCVEIHPSFLICIHIHLSISIP